jgi:hypothetical protein
MFLLTRTTTNSGPSKLGAVYFELGGVTHSVGAFFAAASAIPMAVLQLDWIRATVLLRSKKALIGLAQD